MLKFRKIASVLASAFMVGSSVAIAAAASFPDPFVKGGTADVAVVWGSASATLDLAAVTNVASKLSDAYLAQNVGGTVTTVSGEAKAIETSGQKLYLGDYMNTTKASFTKTDLPTILADGTVVGSDGTSYDYNQKIILPNTYVDYSKTSDSLSMPILFVNFESSAANFKQDIVFPTAVNLGNLSDKDITLFGKKFKFSSSSGDLTATQVVLYEDSQSSTINSGASTEVTVAGVKYTINVVSVEDSTSGSITVNGVSQRITEGSSYKVSGLDIYVKNVFGPSVAGEARGVEMSFGSAKLTLRNGESVTKGSTTIDGTYVNMTSSAGKVSKISIIVTPYSLGTSVKYLRAGNDTITDPVFGAFKLNFVGSTPGLEDSSKDTIVIKPSGETKASIEWTNKVGHRYSMDMLKTTAFGENATSAGVGAPLGLATTNSTVPAVGDYRLIITPGANVTQSDYFIVGSGHYSQIFRLETIRNSTSKRELVVKDAYVDAGDSARQTLSLDSNDQTTLTLDDGSTATLTMNGSYSNGVGGVKVSAAKAFFYTQSGAKIDLTNADAPANNLSKVIITEKTPYNEGRSRTKNDATSALGAGTINVTVAQATNGRSGLDLEVTSTVAGDAAALNGVTVGDYDKYFLTKYGTFIKQAGSTDKTVTLYYPGDVASMGVYISEASATIGGAGSTLGNVQFKDTEVTSVSSKNLIVVGGSCVNTVAAKLLDSATPLCGAAWTAKTNIAAGEALIQVFASPYSTGKVAMLVAGFNVADTAMAAKYLATTTQTIDTTVGKKLKVTSETAASVVAN